MAVTEGFVEGEGSAPPVARAGRDGAESSRPLLGPLPARRSLRMQRGVSSSGRQGGAAETSVINLVSSGDEDSGDDNRGPEHDGGGASTRTQQELPDTPIVMRAGNRTVLTPNFRSAAAVAGWDDETLLMAAAGRGTPDGPPCPNSCEGCPQCRERKRFTRTPGLAATPLSAGRRHRRVRRVNEDHLDPIPMAVFIDEDEKRGESACEAKSLHQQPFEGKENKDSNSSANTANVKSTAKVDEGLAVKNDTLQLDKLREELTCVVCLDICFEPSTTSCGHSFCRGCLQSVYIKCGLRCPKCRQELRSTVKTDCPINTVLWNTIQLLFPQESAARLKDQKSDREKDDQTLVDSARNAEADSQLRLGLVRRRITRPIPWRELGTASRGTELSRPNLSNASENLRWRGPGSQASYRTALEVLESASSYPHGFLRLRGRRPISSSWRNPDILRQEEDDAALAARLQESFISEAGL